MTNQIHPTAVVSDKAELGSGNEIGPYSIIEDGVVLGNNNVITAHAVIKRGTQMGDDNTVAEMTVLGGLPKHTGFTDPSVQTFLKIGNNNSFGESVTVNRAYHEGEATIIGNNNYLMVLTHVGHDCVLGNNITIGIAGIAGHVIIEDKVFISGGVMVHQFVRIGEYAMLGGNTKITKDCPPYMLIDGFPAVVRGINLVGLKRAGFTKVDMSAIRNAYRILYQSGNKLDQALEEVEQIDCNSTKHLAEFIRQSERGVHRAK
ncbi:acyl-ACP--UDP-N-acetylglucosamine O-acyltransferase [Kaarinaea lacus]